MKKRLSKHNKSMCPKHNSKLKLYETVTPEICYTCARPKNMSLRYKCTEKDCEFQICPECYPRPLNIFVVNWKLSIHLLEATGIRTYDEYIYGGGLGLRQ